MSNKVNNRRYSFLSFLPLFLFNEYKYFCNLYFLLIALSQFFPPFKVGLLVTYIGPVILLTGLSFIKELWDEIKRSRKDKVLNTEEYKLSKKRFNQRREKEDKE